MNQSKMIRRLLSKAAWTLALIVALPTVASAVPISLSGSVDEVSGFGTSPFQVGDSLNGLFNVNADPDNSFQIDDLLDFTLTIGPATFNLTGADFSSFNGQLSTDGSMLTDFAVASQFVAASGVDGLFALGFNGVNQPFSVTGFTSIASGGFSANVGAVAVPEPSLLVMFGFVTLALGFAARRRLRGERLGWGSAA